MKSYKIKSLLYFSAFILSALFAYSLETSEIPSQSESQDQVAETTPSIESQPIL